MADDINATDTAPDEKYQGTGKFVSAVGRGATEYAVVGSGASAIAYSGIKIAEKMGKEVSDKSLIGIVIGTVALGTIAGLHGLYKGVQSSRQGKSQFDALKVQVNDLQGRQDVIAAAVNGKDAPAK